MHYNNTGLLIKNEWLILLAIVLHSINFMGYGRDWIFLVIGVAFHLVMNNKSLCDTNQLLLFVFGGLELFFFYAYDFGTGPRTIVNFLFLPASYYFIGKYLAAKYFSFDLAYLFLFFMVIVSCVVPFISNVIDVINNGFMVQRNIKLIWNPADNVPATLVSAKHALNMSLFATLFVTTTNSNEKKLKIISLVLFAVGVFSLSNMSTRQGFVISILSVCGVIFLLDIKRGFSLIVKLVMMVLLIIFLLSNFGVLDRISESRLVNRFDTMAMEADIHNADTLPRVFRWPVVIKGMWQHPLGGKKTIFPGDYAHNLWLDVGWKVGVVPLLVLLLFTKNSIVTILSVARNKHYSLYFRSLISCFGLAFFATFMVEPILEGLFDTFCQFCFFIGMMNIWQRKKLLEKYTHEYEIKNAIT